MSSTLQIKLTSGKLLEWVIFWSQADKYQIVVAAPYQAHSFVREVHASRQKEHRDGQHAKGGFSQVGSIPNISQNVGVVSNPGVPRE